MASELQVHRSTSSTFPFYLFHLVWMLRRRVYHLCCSLSYSTIDVYLGFRLFFKAVWCQQGYWRLYVDSLELVLCRKLKGSIPSLYPIAYLVESLIRDRHFVGSDKSFRANRFVICTIPVFFLIYMLFSNIILDTH